MCDVDRKSIISDGDFKSKKLGQILMAQGFKAVELSQNGIPPQAAWIIINYFAVASKTKAEGAINIYHRYLNKPYPNYFNTSKIVTKKAEYLYLIHSKDANCVKIGISNNPEKRLKGLQTGFPYSLEIIKTIRSSNVRDLERRVHGSLDDYRLNGEWFDDSFLNYVAV